MPTAGAAAGRRPVTRSEAYLAGAAVLFMLGFAWLIRDYYMDDAFIGFQYLKSLLAGHGFVFHPGAPAVEGVTNIGWQIVLAPFALFAGAPAASKILGLTLALMALWLVGRIGMAIDEPAGGASGIGGPWLVPVLLLATSFDFLYFALAGMETALLAVLLLLMVGRAGRNPASPALPALAAAACLAHPEAIVVLPLYCAIGLSGAFGDRRRLLAAIGMLIGLVLAITALRWGYFGDLVPNTFHAKSGGLFFKIDGAFNFLSGRNVNIAFPISGAMVLPFMVFGYLRIHRSSPALAAMLAAIAATGIAFGIYSPADWTELGRYFAPYLPAALILAWCGLVEVVGKVGLPQAPKRGRQFLILAALMLVTTQLYGVLTGMARMEIFPGYVLAGRSLVAPAEWIRDNTAEDAIIASRRIGALAYHSDRPVFDYVNGLTERDVAALVAGRGTHLEATDEELASAWAARAPDYILEDDDVLEGIIDAAGGTSENFTVHGIAYGVVRRFTIGTDVEWVLAGRNDLP